MEPRDLTDGDWAPLRDAVPSFADTWKSVVAESGYIDNLPSDGIRDFAQHVVENVVRQRPEEMRELADTLEAEFTKSMLRDDERYAGFLRVGFLEELIWACDERGMPLTRLTPLLRGPRTRQHWEEAIAWQRPGFVWDDEKGEQPTHPVPRPVGTVEVHRGRRLDPERYSVDVRLIGGRLDGAEVLRQANGKHFWLEWRILEARHRSAEIQGEYELILSDAVREDFDWWDFLLADDDRYWQLATGFAHPPEEP